MGIGVGATLGLIIMTGVAGAWLARSQGLEILQRIQHDTAKGQMPAQTLIDGALILVGLAMLVVGSRLLLDGAVAFAVLQGVDLLVPVLGLTDSVTQGTALLLLIGAPVAILLGWLFDWTPEGLQRTTEANPDELSRIISAPALKRWPSGLLALAGMLALLAGAWAILVEKETDTQVTVLAPGESLEL